MDKIFLLSVDEVQKYLPKNGDRISYSRSTLNAPKYHWVLRDYKFLNNFWEINSDGELTNLNAGARTYLRPAVWIDLKPFLRVNE